MSPPPHAANATWYPSACSARRNTSLMTSCVLLAAVLAALPTGKADCETSSVALGLPQWVSPREQGGGGSSTRHEPRRQWVLPPELATAVDPEDPKHPVHHRTRLEWHAGTGMAGLGFGFLRFLRWAGLCAVAVRSACAGECTTYGTCNEQLQRCDCPVGRTGDDCSAMSMPGCELLPGCVGLSARTAASQSLLGFAGLRDTVLWLVRR